jgi:hypothetical protein
MAELRLSRFDAEGGELPAVCMCCGNPATTVIAQKYSTDSGFAASTPPEAGPIGCLFLPFWLLATLFGAAAASKARTMTVRTPVCHKHARGATLEAKTITDNSITLVGVSDEFVQAWEKERRADRPSHKEPSKVRCRSCRALNDEAARFCDQCGATME